MESPPKVIRLKRKHDDDSVDTLLIQEEGERAKRARFIFKLQRTIQPNSLDAKELDKDRETPLLKLADTLDRRHFVLENKKRKRSVDETPLPKEQLGESLPDEISDLVKNYLKVNHENKDIDPSRRKRSRRHFKGSAANIQSLPSLNYVYDIYQLEEADSWKQESSQTNVGYVKIVNIDMELLADEKSDSEAHLASDDEDSNDENYYRNDYPEDEDDDRSILFDEYEEGDHINEGSMGPQAPADDQYSMLFQQLENSDDILSSINTSAYMTPDNGATPVEHDMDDIPRNKFFPSDTENPLAYHRDRIFHNLQNMINERK